VSRSPVAGFVVVEVVVDVEVLVVASTAAGTGAKRPVFASSERLMLQPIAHAATTEAAAARTRVCFLMAVLTPLAEIPQGCSPKFLTW